MNRALLLAFVLASGPFLAAADAAAVAAALARPADAARYPQAGAVVLLDDQVVALDARGRATTTGHLLVKILQDRAVRSLGDQRIPFRGDRERCRILAARTRLPDRRILEPEANGIMEVSDPEAAAAPFYSSARLRVVAFPGVQPGAVLELNYRIEPGPRPGAPEPFMGSMVFGGAEPVLRKRLTLRVPAGVALRWRMLNAGPAPVVRRAGGSMEYTWTVQDQPQILAEPGMVPVEDLAPRLVWTTAAGPAPLGRWLSRAFRRAAAPDPRVAAEARRLVEGAGSPEDRAERLARFVTQDIRTVPLDLGRVGYRPSPAGVVLANRYADSRDKFVLFQALAQAAGLEADPVLVHQDRTRMSGLACLDEYQGLLARVRLPSGARLYDLDQDRARLGDLLPDDAGRPALLAQDAGGRFLTTPASGLDRQYLRARWDMALDAQDGLAGRVTLTFGGMFDQQVRELLAGRTPEERRVLLQSRVDGLRRGARLEDVQVSDLLDLRQPAQVTLTLRIPDFACRQDDLTLLNLPADLALLGRSPAVPVLPAMRHPFLVPATCRLETSLTVRLPAGIRVAYQPPAADLRQGPLEVRAAAELRAGAWHLDRSITWREGVVAPEAYPDLWRTYAGVAGPGNRLVLLERN